ncbi:hypothetical protein BDV34DRAFT_196526 [Aspergillus parasiticus]|uniref:Uncharacterized protein n=1 Tax=Aspergillus parasiticus TaxID=5067 RepID=A0A5N6DIG2_ASPPA|nr:hypothetical protein BDV34DRAFT_196526 [Aspergillus parasiticus]
MDAEQNQRKPFLSSMDRPISDNNEKPRGAKDQFQMWTPIILHPFVLIAFAILFAIFLAVTEVLYQYSNKHQGLSTSDQKYHYLWTYAPTAVFLIVAGFWGQVEYRSKQLAPWHSMNQRARPASQSLLLDYITPWNVISMFRSMKNKHWAVGLSVLGSLLITLLTVFSTGLFMLDSVRLQNIPTTLKASAQFNSGGYDSKMVDGVPALSVAGAGRFNLSYPTGTTDQYAFSPFNASNTDLGTNTVITGKVDLFSAHLECEQGKLVNWTTYDITADGTSGPGFLQPSSDLTLSSPSCSTNPFQASLFAIPSHNSTAADVFFENCTGNGQTGSRIIFASARLWTAGPKYAISDMYPVFCKPTYTISKGLISLFASNQSVARLLPLANETSRSNAIPGIGSSEIIASLNSSLVGAEKPVSLFPTGNTSISHLGTLYRLANMSSPFDAESLFEPSSFQNISIGAYQSIVAQIARQHFMTPADSQFTGTYSATKQRLMVRELSVRAMEAILAALILVVAVMLVCRPVRSTPRDPGPLSGLAAILARSSHLTDRLDGTLNKKNMKARLTGGLYVGEVTNQNGEKTFRIEAKYPENNDSQPADTDVTISWWHSISRWWQIVSILLPILIIAGLEAAYQESHRHDGLGNITSDGYIQYVWVYIPALVMLLVRILTNGIHSSSMILQPYLELKRGAATASSIMENHLSKITLYSFCCALFKKQFVLAASALSVIIAPLLTIAVSGLYSTQDATVSRPVSIMASDSFNQYGGPAHGDETGSPLIGSLIVARNMSYPAWTHGELITPILREDTLTDLDGDIPYQPSNKTSDDSALLHLTIPALRVNANCTALPREKISLKQFPAGGSSKWELQMHFGPDCRAYSGTTMTVQSDNPNATQTVFGQFTDYIAFFGDCPPMAVLYGTLTPNNSTSGVHGFTCKPYVNQVEANATFAYPGLQIQSMTVDESTMKPFPGFTVPGFTSSMPNITNSAGNKAFDSFFSIMMSNQGTLNTSDIVNPDAMPSVINATQHLYRVLIAQYLNVDARTAPTASIPYNGTLSDPTRVRLVQSEISTRILEGCLAAMTICSLIAVFGTRTRKILPINPCSIAGATTLLAGSDILKSDIFPPGSEWYNDKEMTGRGIFNGLIFGLGWWDRKRYGIDIGKPAETLSDG